MLSQAQSTAPKSGGAGGRISGDKLARVLTPAIGMTAKRPHRVCQRAAGPKSGLDIAHLISLVRAMQRLPKLPPLDQQIQGEYRSENPDALYQYVERAPHSANAPQTAATRTLLHVRELGPRIGPNSASTKSSQRLSIYPWRWVI